MSVRRVGVLGTFVWDTIRHPDRSDALEQWGGLAYCVAAFSAAAPRGWEVVPIARVGADLAGEVRSFLSSLPHLSSRTRIDVVDRPNNRVELVYRDRAERSERLTGGVPAWAADHLAHAVEDLDALYVNHMSGLEMTLPVALELRRRFRGPLYADLHSLFLTPPRDRPRRPRRLPAWRDWLGTADVVQLNEVELGLLGPANAPPPPLDRLLDEGPSAVLVTRGPTGASFAARPGTPDLRLSVAADVPPGRAVLGDVPLSDGALAGDPTGCGDVWGSVVFCGLLKGLGLEAAIRRGHRAAAARIRHGRMSGLERAISSALDS